MPGTSSSSEMLFIGLFESESLICFWINREAEEVMTELAVCNDPAQPLCLILLYMAITGSYMAGGWEEVMLNKH